ncbi:hypothetical protein [Allokutzneria sp. NRRL B-24872]|uniref:hypothetical protein n=1 Tax=Allokutzneria sp. NRRL B-24872 TaxID=1137961 RepID=UPI000A3BB31C|nr:hypothetical protein [Allokutzneria sp. NRRL B-24872]
MLVEVVGTVVGERGAVLAEVRTPVGAVTVRWCGDQEPSVGAHEVEWELDADFRWGHDVRRVEGRSEWLRQHQREIIFRGRSHLADEEPSLVHLELAGSVIDLGWVEGMPTDLPDPWVEVRVLAEKVALHPYLV